MTLSGKYTAIFFIFIGSIIGMAAASIARSPQGGALMAEEGVSPLSFEQKKEMLSIARSTITAHLKGVPAEPYKTNDDVLCSVRGVFVSVYVDGNLRGCIGDIRGTSPLYEGIREKSIASATEDRRFAPLKPEEIGRMKIGISVLTPLRKVKNADEIEMGKHGVVVSRGARGGVFLPQVATKTGWSKEEFLGELCFQKAGLPPDAWKDENTALYVFTAEEFDENQILTK